MTLYDDQTVLARMFRPGDTLAIYRPFVLAAVSSSAATPGSSGPLSSGATFSAATAAPFRSQQPSSGMVSRDTASVGFELQYGSSTVIAVLPASPPSGQSPLAGDAAAPAAPSEALPRDEDGRIDCRRAHTRMRIADLRADMFGIDLVGTVAVMSANRPCVTAAALAPANLAVLPAQGTTSSGVGATTVTRLSLSGSQASAPAPSRFVLRLREEDTGASVDVTLWGASSRALRGVHVGSVVMLRGLTTVMPGDGCAVVPAQPPPAPPGPVPSPHQSATPPPKAPPRQVFYVEGDFGPDAEAAGEAASIITIDTVMPALLGLPLVEAASGIESTDARGRCREGTPASVLPAKRTRERPSQAMPFYMGPVEVGDFHAPALPLLRRFTLGELAPRWGLVCRALQEYAERAASKLPGMCRIGFFIQRLALTSPPSALLLLPPLSPSLPTPQEQRCARRYWEVRP